MAGTHDVAELMTGVTVAMTTLVAQLIAELRDVGAITDRDSAEIVASLARTQREMSERPQKAGTGQAEVYGAVADVLDAMLPQFTGNSPSSP